MESNKIYIVTVDSTDNGEYQNNAHSLVFETLGGAVKYVHEDIADTEENDNHEGETSWYGENEAQYRRGDVIVDWKIEEASICK